MPVIKEVVPKCRVCGRKRDEHKYGDRACPVGRKHRVYGFTTFSPTQTYTPKLPRFRYASHVNGVTNFPYQKRPCAECPWRCGNPPGKFPVERYKALVNTSTDMATQVFGCHMSTEKSTVACAGFLLSQDARHNMTLRMRAGRGYDWQEVKSDVELYPNYYQLAVANGVDEDDPALAMLRMDCRGDGTEENAEEDDQ